MIPSWLAQLGVTTGVLVVAGAALWRPVERWLLRRVDAQVELRVEERVRAYQHGLDKELETHRQALQQSAERIRLDHQRALHDFALYAAQRHEAERTLFARFLQAEAEITDLRPFVYPAATEASEPELREALTRLGASPEVASQVLRDFADHNAWAVDHALKGLSETARTTMAMRVRNSAYEAYYANVLYLPPAVDAAARLAQEGFHDCLSGHLVPKDGRIGREMLEQKARLRFRLLELQNAIKADLSQAAARTAETVQEPARGIAPSGGLVVGDRPA